MFVREGGEERENTEGDREYRHMETWREIVQTYGEMEKEYRQMERDCTDIERGR